MSIQPNAKEAYDAGAKAKRQGFGRVTPYYEQPRSDYWWLAGFDGLDFFKAERKQPEFVVGIPSDEFPPAPIRITPEQARERGMPVPEGVDRVMVLSEFMSVDILQNEIQDADGTR